MSKALFISVLDLKKRSILDGNIDSDKVIQFIEVAQDTHIQNYLGGKLYQKLQDIIIAGTVDQPANSNYKLLLNTYIKPMLIWYAQSNFLPFAMYQISNGGVFKHRSENSDTVTYEEMSMLVNRVAETADFYTRRFLDYMSYNSTLYPEYTSNSNDDMYPDKDVNFHGWVL